MKQYPLIPSEVGFEKIKPKP